MQNWDCFDSFYFWCRQHFSVWPEKELDKCEIPIDLIHKRTPPLHPNYFFFFFSEFHFEYFNFIGSKSYFAVSTCLNFSLRFLYMKIVSISLLPLPPLKFPLSNSWSLNYYCYIDLHTYMHVYIHIYIYMHKWKHNLLSSSSVACMCICPELTNLDWI